MDKAILKNPGFRTRILKVLSGLLPVIAAMALASCESLPEGEPPKGAIVEIVDAGKGPASPEQAINRMATFLTMKLVQGARMKSVLELKAETDGGLGEELLKSLVKSKMAVDAASLSGKGAESREMLESHIKDGMWSVRIVSQDGRKVFCLCAIEVKSEGLEGAE